LNRLFDFFDGPILRLEQFVQESIPYAKLNQKNQAVEKSNLDPCCLSRYNKGILPIIIPMLTITSEHEKLIQSRLETGRYANAEEVLAIALHLLARLNTEHQAWIEDTRQQIATGIAELDRGEGIDGPTVMNQYLQQFQTAQQTLPS
jgi:antitoxin ParD1/3/4